MTYDRLTGRAWCNTKKPQREAAVKTTEEREEEAPVGENCRGLGLATSSFADGVGFNRFLFEREADVGQEFTKFLARRAVLQTRLSVAERVANHHRIVASAWDRDMNRGTQNHFAIAGCVWLNRAQDGDAEGFEAKCEGLGFHNQFPSP